MISKEEFNSLGREDRVMTINRLLKENPEQTVQGICDEIGVKRPTLSGNFSDWGYEFNSNERKYVPKQTEKQEQIEGQESIFKTIEEQESQEAMAEIMEAVQDIEEATESDITPLNDSKAYTEHIAQQETEAPKPSRAEDKKLTIELSPRTYKAMQVMKALEDVNFNTYIEDLLKSNLKQRYFDIVDEEQNEVE